MNQHTRWGWQVGRATPVIWCVGSLHTQQGLHCECDTYALWCVGSVHTH
jgi:hypothetical protein